MRIVLADEISPDNCRLWDVKTNEKLDKDRFRRDLGRVEEAYQEVARRLGILPEGGPGDAKTPRRCNEGEGCHLMPSRRRASPPRARRWRKPRWPAFSIMPKEGVLDPQGKAIAHATSAPLGFSGVGEVRQGKRDRSRSSSETDQDQSARLAVDDRCARSSSPIP